MKLSNTKLQYMLSGAYVDVQELKSCDVAFTTSGSRSLWNREGTYTNEAIDSLEINFERGYNTLLDNSGLNKEIVLKWNNGALAYEGTFVINNKINKKENGKTITFISFIPKLGETISIKARGGEGGHVDDVEVDGVSVVTGGVAEINLAQCVKKAAGTQEFTLGVDAGGVYIVK